MKLGLGTVQFGINYGVSNSTGQTSPSEVSEILRYARAHKIEYLDTAPSYGESEKILGENLLGLEPYKIVTKTIKGRSSENLEAAFQKSLSDLQQSSVYGLMVHDPADLLSEKGEALYTQLLRLKEQGWVQKIGVSIYSTNEIELILEKFKVDLIQLPVNVFDQRLVKNRSLKKLKDLGIEIHVRSAFLQGLLLMDLENIPTFFSSINDHLKRFKVEISQFGLSSLEAAIQFLKGISEIDVVIIGVNTIEHLEEIIKAAQKPLTVFPNFESYALTDERILNPSKWKLR